MEQMKIKGKERRGMEIFLHVTGWIILFILPQILLVGRFMGDMRSSLIIFFHTLVFGIVFYLNYLLLIPVLLHRRKGLFYWPAAIILVFIMYSASNYAFPKLFPPPENSARHERIERKREEEGKRTSFPERMAIYNYFITSALVTGFALALNFSEQAHKKEGAIKELEKEKLNSELALLKNQVSPHFFFNTLNNIYSLIEINQKDAQDAVLSLSKMMRYLLYESEQGNTRLSHEIEFMRGYIDLMKLRMSSRVKLDVNFPDKYSDIDLPPLIFIPFIENAFKHGISYQGKSFIEISLVISEKAISFKTRNSITRTFGQEPRTDSGIGLENVKKRLTLLYPQKHKLEIADDDNVYSVDLQIDISKA